MSAVSANRPDLDGGQAAAAVASTPVRTARLPHVARGAAINFSGIIGRTFFAYAYTFLLAHKLSTEGVGQYYIIATIVNLLGLGGLIGLDMGVVRFVAIYAGKKDVKLAGRSLNLALLVAVPVGIAFAVGLFFAAPWASRTFLDGAAVTELRIFGIAIPLLVAARLFNCTTQGLHQMRYQVYSRDLGEQAVKVGLTAAVLFAGLGLMGVVYANIASVIVALLLSMYFAVNLMARLRRRHESGTEDQPAGAGKAVGRAVSAAGTPAAASPSGLAASPGRALFWYSMPLALANMLVALWLQIDKLLLGYLGTTESVAFYGVALSLAIFSSRIITAFGTVFSPIISDLWSRDKREELDILFKTVTRWIFILTLPIFLVLAIFSDGIMRLFGTDYTAGAAALILLALGQLFNASTGACGLMILMSGRSKLELLNVIVTLVLDVSLCFLLIPSYGILGAAIANMACVILVNFMRVAEVWIFMRMQAYDLSYFKPVLAGAASAVFMLIIARFALTISGVKLLGAATLLLVALYVGLILLLGLNQSDRDLLKRLRAGIARS